MSDNNNEDQPNEEKVNNDDERNDTSTTSNENPVDNSSEKEESSKGNDNNFNVENLEKQPHKVEGKKQKTVIKLPTELELDGGNIIGEQEKVGDDVTKREQHIVCECEPNVSGAGVPTVCSFNKPPSNVSSEFHPSEIKAPSSVTADNTTIGETSNISENIPDEKNDNTSTNLSYEMTDVETTQFMFYNDLQQSSSAVKSSGNLFPEISNSSVDYSVAKVSMNAISNHYPTYDNNLDKIDVSNTINTKEETEALITKSEEKTNITESQCCSLPSNEVNTKSSSNKNLEKSSERRQLSKDNDQTPIKKSVDDVSKKSNEKILQSTKSENHKSKVTLDKSKDSKQIVLGEKSSSHIKKRPSLIPKLSRPNSKNTGREQSDSDKHHRINQLIDRFSEKNVIKSTIAKIKSGTLQKKSSAQIKKIQNSSSTKIVGFQDKLKLITSRESRSKLEESKDMLPDINSDSKELYDPVEDLYKNILQMKRAVLDFTAKSTWKQPKEFTEKLMSNINEIKKIADKLNATNVKVITKDESTQSVDVLEPQLKKDAISKTSKTKDNKVYIKFMQSRKSEKRIKEESTNGQEETAYSEKMSDSEKSDQNLDEVNKEIKVKESDSLDGVFIPTAEPPKNIEEEEEETSGLDITITFPEFNQLLSDRNESHLSLRLSDISADALRKLKRCPKDFTLRMDFVQGRVHFQTGKAPANYFSIGPDLKFVENATEGKSDIIDIKPSTECKFGSQMISVENVKERSSHKSLKSTDSELFNVVNLPFIYRTPSMNTVTKSCMTFKNDSVVSMAYIARHFFKSMPQIPSLTNIFEDKLMESLNRTAISNSDKKRKIRQAPKKALTSNTAL